MLPETVPTTAVPYHEFPPSSYATTNVLADSAVAEILPVDAVLNTYSEPQVIVHPDIVHPDTVPTIAVPYPEFPASLYATTKVLSDSAAAEILPVDAGLNTSSEPHKMVLPETVPFTAVPYEEFPPSAYATTTVLADRFSIKSRYGNP